MARKLETEYRLRWRKTGAHHRTRYYSRQHFAVRAAERYESNGFEVELCERSIVVYDDWQLVTGGLEQAVSAATPRTLKQKPTSTCAVCGVSITEVEPGVWRAKGDYGGVCKNNRPMLHHVPNVKIV